MKKIILALVTLSIVAFSRLFKYECHRPSKPSRVIISKVMRDGYIQLTGPVSAFPY